MTQSIDLGLRNAVDAQPTEMGQAVGREEVGDGDRNSGRARNF